MKPRVLTISKPYIAAAYRQKLKLLADSGRFEMGLICPPAWGSQRFEDEPSPSEPSPYWMRVLPIRFNGHNHFHFYRGLEAAIRSFRPDVLNIEEEHYSLVTWQTFRIARRLGVPAIFYTWQNIAKRYPPPFAQIERYVFKNAAAAVVGNKEAGEILRQKGYGGTIHEIPQMGVDLPRFAPAVNSPERRLSMQSSLGLPAATLWLSFMGRLVEEKGVQDILHALRILRSERAEAAGAIRLLLVGSGPYLPTLESLARELGVQDQLLHISHIPSHAVANYLQAVDVLCLPSLTRANWKEQFGRILAEAMAAEAVVVGSSSGEIPRVIADAGYVFPEGDARALAAIIGHLADNAEVVARLRVRGAARVRARFTMERISNAFADVFDEVLSRR